MQRLTQTEREFIEVWVRSHKRIRWMARQLGRDHSVVSRELKRNKGEQTPYTASVALRVAGERARKTNVRKLEKYPKLREYVVKMLKEDWSPEQIAGRLEEQPPPELEGKSVSYEAIYNYIYKGPGRFERLYPHLRRGQKRRTKQRARKAKKTSIPERISIHERPEEVDARVVGGHWESDTVCGGIRPPALSVQYERKTMLARIHKTRNKSADETENAIRKSIDSLPDYFWKTITFDNGSEGASHTNLRHDYDLMTYHCDPYASWQKGGVENLNGLIRQYVPKKADLTKYTHKQIQTIQEKLNNRPRKKLNYLTPNEMLALETEKVVH